MSYVGFEPTIPASERAKTVHALDRSATVIGLKDITIIINIITIFIIILIIIIYRHPYRGQEQIATNHYAENVSQLLFKNTSRH
jgi:hypothetical protein